MSCSCPEPVESSNPRNRGTCNKCARPIPGDVLSNDQTVKAFFDRLSSALPGEPPDSFLDFRELCERREREGRDRFGLQYLRRDNCLEAAEEAADLALYMHLELLRERRAAVSSADSALAFTAAYHAYLAFDASRRLRSTHRGSP